MKLHRWNWAIRCRKPPSCEAGGGSVWSKGYRSVVLVDLPAFGWPVRLRWRKRLWTCPNPECEVRSFNEQDPTIGGERALLTSRVARWVTVQVGRPGSPCRRRCRRTWLRVVYGEQTTSAAGVKRCWRLTLLGWEQSKLWDSTRHCSGVRPGGALSSGVPLWSMWEIG